jgi:molybdenum cofactor cytidylyltransferase
VINGLRAVWRNETVRRDLIFFIGTPVGHPRRVFFADTMTKRKEKTAGLILMAGASSRMGMPKPLLKIGKKTLVEHLLDEALKSHLDRVIVVVAPLAAEMEAVLAPYEQNRRFRAVENSRSREGMSSSIIAGLDAVEQECDHLMVILGDMPGVDSNIINHLLNGYLASHKTMGAITVGRKRSHPVIFGREWYGDLRKLGGDTGARGLLDGHGEAVCLVDAPPSYDHRDMDTPDDYRAFLGDQGEPDR